MRSLMIGDCNHYCSPYMTGVADASARLGIEHREVSIRQPIDRIRIALDEVNPDLVWTHMLLWPPQGSPRVEDLVDLMKRAARGGARVVIHDGDCKERTRFPVAIDTWCSMALVNHAHDRSAWKVPIVRWPYFAQYQERIAAPDPRWRCDLWFAGQVGTGAIYDLRTRILGELVQRGIGVRRPLALDGNTLKQTPAIAASADAVLGFGRPEIPGWIDTRVTQYPGAGGILVHDDAGGLLEPWVHFAPYRSGDAGSIAEALGRLRAMPDSSRWALRERAFAHVQRNHNSIARVREVLACLRMSP